MKQNFNTVFKKFGYKLYQFGKIRKYINPATRVLIYKQTVLPLTEYVSFVMTLNNKHEVEKLQKLQNRALRMCYNIQNPKDMSITRLHDLAHVDLLHKRRLVQLMSIMYEKKSHLMHERVVVRNTRQADRYIFDINRVNLDLYSRSPYYVGSKFWNDLPGHVQDLNTKEQYKRAILDLL